MMGGTLPRRLRRLGVHNLQKIFPHSGKGADTSRNTENTVRSFAMMTAIIKRPEAEDDGGVAIKSELRRMLTEQQVLAVVPISRTTLFRLMKQGKFPRAVYVSA